MALPSPPVALALPEVGASFPPSGWFTVDLERNREFGRLTDDVEPLHTDPAWCAAHSPFGVPIVYGFLTLSLLTRCLHEVTGGALSGTAARTTHALNYGFDRVRFVLPVPVGARLRAHVTLAERRPRADGELLRFDVALELDGESRPALVAEWWSLCARPATAVGQGA